MRNARGRHNLLLQDSQTGFLRSLWDTSSAVRFRTSVFMVERVWCQGKEYTKLEKCHQERQIREKGYKR
ncbi:hypothetical protein PGT21_005179 [Puccinia graminis f. sp. tritici]|uniref:Uncharacterized protein n=1 Tax=Puccinia graminis f. sp. tritici TaxID=56615 RepID=A0A5B0PJR7_PUCGR|nr:hypothetical protein PGTUg99_020237 [Puccinia graminis f. sp. tritici]KAA1101042.1 hypothetical protein PGT21_005179 [Puccinia graminis f. sp. tritici]